MSEMIIITMPDPDEVLRRLIEVNNNPHLVERFYPIVQTKLADREQTGTGVVNALHLAAYDYTEDMPSLMMRGLLVGLYRYVRALLDGTGALDDALSALSDLGLPRG